MDNLRISLGRFFNPEAGVWENATQLFQGKNPDCFALLFMARMTYPSNPGNHLIEICILQNHGMNKFLLYGGSEMEAVGTKTNLSPE